jgi:hypothetical protein
VNSREAGKPAISRKEKRMEERRKTGEGVDVTRRDVIKGAGMFALGATVLSTAGLSLFGKAEAREKITDADELCDKAEMKASGNYPWPYKKIDPQLAGDIAYRNWYKGFCAYASASAILMPLQLSVGEPYTNLPVEAFAFGHGGTVGWGTLCGTLFGSGIAASFAAGKTGEKIINDVMMWYTETQLPIYTPGKPKATFKSTNASGSPLCHISVGKWMAKENVAFFSPQRKDRCARLAADVAMKTVTLLNAWADGTYKPVHGGQATMYQITEGLKGV